MPQIRYQWKTAQAFSPGRSRPITGIVLHSTDGHEQGDITTLTGPKVSVHWYVTKDGRYWHFVQNSDTAWHAGKTFDPKFSNSGSIGIEQEHIDGEEEWPDVLVQATAVLVTALRQKYGNLPAKSHSEVASPKGRKEDPKDFPWKKFSELVKAAVLQKWEFVPE